MGGGVICKLYSCDPIVSFYLRGRKIGKHIPIYWFTSQMPTVAKAGQLKPEGKHLIPIFHMSGRDPIA